ncbi:hypothetical protein Tco_0922123 [Tanacetum coccineum]|uniref:Uncharacterized protein n=1 Tax=Tanacetum coccineum TaxID=301880 RepID=A0ABQ5D4G7_9ASTR
MNEEIQLKAFLGVIVPDEEGEINYEVLNRRYPIVNWESKFYHTDRYGKPHDYYRVFRADGSSRHIKTFTEMVSSLRTMFEANVEDVLWKNQERMILESWNFYITMSSYLGVEIGKLSFYIASRKEVMAAPTIHVSIEENLEDPINIKVDIIHPEPVVAVAFPAAAVVRTLAQHGEAIWGMQGHLLGVPIQEELTAIKQQLATVQESHRQDQEDFRKLKELVTSQFGQRS